MAFSARGSWFRTCVGSRRQSGISAACPSCKSSSGPQLHALPRAVAVPCGLENSATGATNENQIPTVAFRRSDSTRAGLAVEPT